MRIPDWVVYAIVLVAIVGPAWLGPIGAARYRIQSETDRVRVPIELAIERTIPMMSRRALGS